MYLSNIFGKILFAEYSEIASIRIVIFWTDLNSTRLVGELCCNEIESSMWNKDRTICYLKILESIDDSTRLMFVRC